jgi:hypothetical protein
MIKIDSKIYTYVVSIRLSVPRGLPKEIEIYNFVVDIIHTEVFTNVHMQLMKELV